MFCCILGGMNEAIFQHFGENETLSSVTDVFLIATLLFFMTYVGIGLVQLIRRKSLKKVDAELLAMIPSTILMAVIYVIFEKLIVVNTRPISDEPSFPSTHTLVVATIFLMAMQTLPRYVKNRKTRTALYVAMSLVIIVVAAGRVMSGMHWFTDVLGGLAFAAVLAVIYKFVLKKLKGLNNE